MNIGGIIVLAIFTYVVLLLFRLAPHILLLGAIAGLFIFIVSLMPLNVVISMAGLAGTASLILKYYRIAKKEKGELPSRNINRNHPPYY